MKTGKMLILLFALSMCAVHAATVVYKWVDKDGNVHYSTVPHSAKAQPTNIINTASDQAPTASSAPRASSANPVPVISPNDSPACKSAKQQLGKYLTAQALYSVDANGNKVLLSKDKKSQLIQQVRNQVTMACSPTGSPP